MIIICEECGKKYRIDPNKITGEGVKVKCKECGNMIPVTLADKASSQEGSSVSFPAAEADASSSDSKKEKRASREEKRKDKKEKKEKKQKTKKPKEKKQARPKKSRPTPDQGKGLGVRTKMFLLFFLMPFILIIGASALYIWHLQNFASVYNQESKKIIQSMAEEAIAEKSISVAREVKIFLDNHPDLKPEEFYDNPTLRQIGIQKVGETGYTAIYEIPEQEDGPWPTWVHPNTDLVGVDTRVVKEELGKKFEGFWNVFSGVSREKQSKGYYTWRDMDGKLRDKYMVCTPVYGTSYAIAATAYMDVFTRPVKMLETRANRLFQNTRLYMILTLAGLLIIIALVVSLFGHKLSNNIKSLTDVTERISIGDLDAEVEIRSRDEIGQLAQAISRMQESVRLSIERMRRRRQ